MPAATEISEDVAKAAIMKLNMATSGQYSKAHARWLPGRVDPVPL